MNRVYRPARQGVIRGKQIFEDLGIGVTAIGEQRDNPGYELHHMAIVGEESLRDRLLAIAVNGDELVIAQQIEDFCHHNAHALGKVGHAQQRFVGRQDIA